MTGGDPKDDVEGEGGECRRRTMDTEHDLREQSIMFGNDYSATARPG